MAKRDLNFDQVVFSGGGIRCFWHGGFMQEMGDFDAICPERVSGVSGGAMSGAAWIGGVEDDLRDLMHQAFSHNDANLDVGAPNLTPHQHMYRAVVSTTLDEAVIDRIANGPQFEIVLAVSPPYLSPGLAALLGGLTYQLDQRIRSDPHLGWSTKLGLKQIRADGRQAARDGTLVDLICAAATIPPVFDIPTWQGQRVLDGGLIDKAPLPDPDKGRTLVLLTRQYRNLPDHTDREYIQPSKEVAADKIDFSDASKITKTWGQGAEDAQAWLARAAQEA